jgi:hypothetical protein
VQGLPWLAVLSLHQSKMRKLELSSCPRLRVAKASKCAELRTVDLRGAASLQRLSFHSCTELRGLRGMEHLGALKALELDRCGLVKTLSLRLAELEELDVSRCRRLQAMDVAGLSALQEVKIQACVSLQRVDGLEGLGALRCMKVEACDKLGKLQLGGLTALRAVTMCEPCGQLQDGLRGLPALTSLTVKGTHQRMLDLRGLSALQELRLWDWERLQEVVGLGQLRLWEVRPGYVRPTKGDSADSLVAHLQEKGVVFTPDSHSGE